MSPQNLELVRSVVFDTLFLPENLNNGKGTLFCIPLGNYAGRRVKQQEHTSMLMAGMLEAPQMFWVQKIRAGLYVDWPYDGTGYRCGPLPLNDRLWEAGTFQLEVRGNRADAITLRKFASENCWEEAQELYNTNRNGKYGGIRLEPNDPDLERFEEAAVAPRDIPFFIDTYDSLIGRCAFYEPVNVPMTLCVVLEGIRARAVQ